MALKRMALELGMGTSLQREDYTQAAVRALQNALWHNALTVADAFGVPKEAMQIEVTIGVAKPDRVDVEKVAAVLPYGQRTVTVVEGGMDTPKDASDGVTVLANAAVVVWLDLPEGAGVAA